ncbi:hypothetical protein [Undibacterium pigrum]|uniref:Uncharacterized protein n=1 Tax=Undibacterium pigrum TaxID=401470 RepID=A0A318IZ33_9BURK|nr:hypothetical protein [Undibacterium pigrum]PXX41536.1 hypothetical protein DFR42_107187 [Undibacterium pigrum]
MNSKQTQKEQVQEKVATPTVDTTSPGGEVKLPHERDQTIDKDGKPRKVMKQALLDLQQGQKDTDLHGQRGVETVVKPESKPDP